MIWQISIALKYKRQIPLYTTAAKAPLPAELFLRDFGCFAQTKYTA